MNAAASNIKHHVLVLAPAVRHLVRRGLKIQEIEEALKMALIEVIKTDLEEVGEKVNVSRLSIATGLHRRDVMRLWRDESLKDSAANLLTKIVGEWQRRRKVLSTEGLDSEFADLVTSISKDLNPYTVLFELERAGLIEKTARGAKLTRPSYQPSKENIETALQMLHRDASDLYNAVEENMYLDTKIKNLHVASEFDNIPAQHVSAIKKEILARGAAFNAEIKKYLEQFDRDVNPSVTGTGKARVSVGLFSYTKTENKE